VILASAIAALGGGAGVLQAAGGAPAGEEPDLDRLDHRPRVG